jgi:hypothetical protein
MNLLEGEKPVSGIRFRGTWTQVASIDANTPAFAS